MFEYARASPGAGVEPGAGDLLVILLNDDSRSIDDVAAEIVAIF